ncbi:tRNA-uridine aminocarboxypropyltransferase [Rhodoferax aquaticus]|uniref:tRNA-uridine aminocarboxypropyltransferase n=1 Tax=Rhodoferax aquaticus TaxID=2527691 RepID=A0A515EL17_9BURK|nr:tRNA-uridine aminocarboxypropyltransferase [Rhodoferax aquaticus]QDL53355.1 DTW domain-containing protein [Rhodoferax aquaticus]
MHSDLRPLDGPSEPTAQRPRCTRCLRASTACICQWVRPTPHRVQVLILQHPLEVLNAKGTARLLHLGLPRSRLVVGETFAAEDLQHYLFAPWPDVHASARSAESAASGPPTTVLLYPETPDHGALGLPVPPALPAQALSQPERMRLVVLDGTWRKSRKMLFTNPLLHTLPRLPLQQLPPSAYRIRKAHLPDQLSTLEATCAALAQVEGCDVSGLLAGFEGFVAQQLQWRAV